MNKLTAEKCKTLIERLGEDKRASRISIFGELYLQALEIALPVLEQQEREIPKAGYKCPNCGNDGWSASCGHCIPY